MNSTHEECSRQNQPEQEAEACIHSEAAAKSAVMKVFAILGVDVNDPKQVEEFRKDLRFGQSMRKLADKGSLALVGAVFVTIGHALWQLATSFFSVK